MENMQDVISTTVTEFDKSATYVSTRENLLVVLFKTRCTKSLNLHLKVE